MFGEKRLQKYVKKKEYIHDNDKNNNFRKMDTNDLVIFNLFTLSFTHSRIILKLYSNLVIPQNLYKYKKCIETVNRSLLQRIYSLL